MRIRLDEDTCTGHGRCYALAPGLFEADDEDGHGRVRNDVGGDGTVPPGLEDEARRAERNCPERAISASPVAGVAQLRRR